MANGRWLSDSGNWHLRMLWNSRWESARIRVKIGVRFGTQFPYPKPNPHTLGRVWRKQTILGMGKVIVLLSMVYPNPSRNLITQTNYPLVFLSVLFCPQFLTTALSALFSLTRLAEYRSKLPNVTANPCLLSSPSIHLINEGGGSRRPCCLPEKFSKRDCRVKGPLLYRSASEAPSLLIALGNWCFSMLLSSRWLVSWDIEQWFVEAFYSLGSL